MPTTRRRRVRNPRHETHPVVIAYLRDEDPNPADYGEGAVHALWRAEWMPGRMRGIYDVVRADLIEAWARDNPGTRPSAWWKWTATEPRQRIGGTGSLLSDFMSYAPSYHCGMATRWACEALIRKGWPTVSLGGKAAGWCAIQELADAIPFDQNDPPLFESQATYLQRLGILLPGERKRLDAEDFAPEAAVHGDCLACDDFDAAAKR
jgi:hypothetical protein